MKYLSVEAPDQAATVSFLHEHVTVEIDVDGNDVNVRVMDSRAHGGAEASTWDEKSFAMSRTQPEPQEDEDDE